jgi:hypothetical protein
MAKSFLNRPDYPPALRNNNPGNLRAGDNWQGMIGVSEQGFVIFYDIAMGIRALGIDLRSKINKGYNTIEEILYRYAPPSDGNNTEAYINSVVQSTGFSRDQLLSVDVPTLQKLIRAIVNVEAGAGYSHLITDQDINEGISKMGYDISHTTGVVGFSFATLLFVGVAIYALTMPKGVKTEKKRA